MHIELFLEMTKTCGKILSSLISVKEHFRHGSQIPEIKKGD